MAEEKQQSFDEMLSGKAPDKPASDATSAFSVTEKAPEADVSNVTFDERAELNQLLATAKADRPESEIPLNDPYWETRKEVQQQLNKLDEVK